MALEKPNYANIAAYLSGNLAADEKTAMDEWRREKPENESHFKEAQYIWTHSSVRLNNPKSDVEAEWNLLKQKLEKPEVNTISLWSRPSSWLKIAASLILLSVASILIYQSLQPQSYTHRASIQVERIFLPDSTEVWLNSKSALTYDENFGKSGRRVSLQGEGFFKVRRDTSSVFEVSTDHSTTKVLGTTFNLKEDDQNVILNVAEGKVSFAPEKKPDAAVIVEKNETAQVSGKKTPVKTKTNDNQYASWREKNNPIFEKEKFNPGAYLKTVYTWRKNSINQSVIAGTLKSSSALATYKNVVMKVTYTRASGKKGMTRVTIADMVRPGKTIQFEKRLLDIFSDTKSIEMEIEKAEVITRPD